MATSPGIPSPHRKGQTPHWELIMGHASKILNTRFCQFTIFSNIFSKLPPVNLYNRYNPSEKSKLHKITLGHGHFLCRLLNPNTLKTVIYLVLCKFSKWFVKQIGCLGRELAKVWFRTILFGCVLLPSLQWRHNERDGVSIHQPRDCLLNRLLRRRSKKTSKLRVTGLCVGNSPETGEFPTQRASNAENVSIWWRHNGKENFQVCALNTESYNDANFVVIGHGGNVGNNNPRVLPMTTKLASLLGCWCFCHNQLFCVRDFI